MPSEDTKSIEYTCAYLVSNDDLWFHSMDGVVSVNESDLIKNENILPIVITSFTQGDQAKCVESLFSPKEDTVVNLGWNEFFLNSAD